MRPPARPLFRMVFRRSIGLRAPALRGLRPAGRSGRRRVRSSQSASSAACPGDDKRNRQASSSATPASGREQERSRSGRSLAGRTGLDRQQAAGDLPIVRLRLLERAEPAGTKRRLLLHSWLSGSNLGAREPRGCFSSVAELDIVQCVAVRVGVRFPSGHRAGSWERARGERGRARALGRGELSGAVVHRSEVAADRGRSAA